MSKTVSKFFTNLLIPIFPIANPKKISVFFVTIQNGLPMLLLV